LTHNVYTFMPIHCSEIYRPVFFLAVMRSRSPICGREVKPPASGGPLPWTTVTSYIDQPLKTPTNTQDPPLPLRNNCFNPTPGSCSLIFTATRRHFFLILGLHVDVVSVQTVEFHRLCILYYINFLFSPVSVLFYLYCEVAFCQRLYK